MFPDFQPAGRARASRYRDGNRAVVSGSRCACRFTLLSGSRGDKPPSTGQLNDEYYRAGDEGTESLSFKFQSDTG